MKDIHIQVLYRIQTYHVKMSSGCVIKVRMMDNYSVHLLKSAYNIVPCQEFYFQESEIGSVIPECLGSPYRLSINIGYG